MTLDMEEVHFVLNKDKTFYEIIGVTEKSDTEEIKKKFRKLAIKYHPDRARALSEDDQKIAADVMSRLNLIYDTLSKDKTREFYDKYKTTIDSVVSDTRSYSEYDIKDDDAIYKKFFDDSPECKQGEDIVLIEDITFRQSFEGVIKDINYVVANNEQVLRLEIPAGVTHNTLIAKFGLGGAGEDGGRNGNLFVLIHVGNSTNAFRIDNDLVILKEANEIDLTKPPKSMVIFKRKVEVGEPTKIGEDFIMYSNLGFKGLNNEKGALILKIKWGLTCLRQGNY